MSASSDDGEDAAAAAAATNSDEDEEPQQEQQQQHQQGKRRKTSNRALYDLFTHGGVDKPDDKGGRQYVHCIACVEHNQAMTTANEGLRPTWMTPPSTSLSFTRSILSSINPCLCYYREYISYGRNVWSTSVRNTTTHLLP
jgi:hypothetical protein